MSGEVKLEIKQSQHLINKLFLVLGHMRNVTTRHLYFLSRILQDSLLTQRWNQGIAAVIGLSGRCDKVIELFCLVWYSRLRIRLGGKIIR